MATKVAEAIYSSHYEDGFHSTATIPPHSRRASMALFALAGQPFRPLTGSSLLSRAQMCWGRCQGIQNIIVTATLMDRT